MINIIIIILILSVFFITKSPTWKGRIGEIKVSLRLKALGNDYVVLNDILISQSEYSSQIDHLVISRFGIFVIETKNYKGWIFGNEKSEHWMQILYKHKHTFRNPIKQNWSHVYALKSLLSQYKSIKYFPIVVFSNNAELKKRGLPGFVWVMLELPHWAA